jgi:hypothetical protein
MIRLLPDGLYLKSFKQEGDTVTISGYTQSRHGPHPDAIRIPSGSSRPTVEIRLPL